MSVARKVETFWKKYDTEFGRHTISAFVGLVVAAFANYFTAATPLDRVMLGLLAFLGLGFVLLSISIKRNLTTKIKYLQATLPELFEERTTYSIRQMHFPEEKNLLAKELVGQLLPDIISKVAVDEHGQHINLKHVGIAIDSGTTLSPIFGKLRAEGHLLKQKLPSGAKLELFTNNLAGVDAFHRYNDEPRISENELHLFGGHPKEAYRSTTGAVTNGLVQGVREAYDGKVDERGRLIGITTANWILVGKNHRKLILCARGEGHLDFKKALSAAAHLLIVVAPLGKLLLIDELDELNSILRKEDLPTYDQLDLLQSRPPETTFLLTTYRTKERSVLRNHSLGLVKTHADRSQSYKLLGDRKRLAFNPVGNRKEQLEVEIPHEYLRSHAWDLLGVQQES